MIKRYKIKNPDRTWECSVEIDPDFVIESLRLNDEPYTVAMAIKAMVEFWSGYEHRLDLNDGDYTKTFLQQLAREILYIHVSNNYNITGIISDFNNKEGWFAMDGSCGIKITYSDDFEFDYLEFIVLEEEA